MTVPEAFSTHPLHPLPLFLPFVCPSLHTLAPLLRAHLWGGAMCQHGCAGCCLHVPFLTAAVPPAFYQHAANRPNMWQEGAVEEAHLWQYSYHELYHQALYLYAMAVLLGGALRERGQSPEELVECLHPPAAAITASDCQPANPGAVISPLTGRMVYGTLPQLVSGRPSLAHRHVSAMLTTWGGQAPSHWQVYQQAAALSASALQDYNRPSGLPPFCAAAQPPYANSHRYPAATRQPHCPPPRYQPPAPTASLRGPRASGSANRVASKVASKQRAASAARASVIMGEGDSAECVNRSTGVTEALGAMMGENMGETAAAGAPSVPLAGFVPAGPVPDPAAMAE